MRWGRIGGSVLIILIVEVMVSVVEGAEASYQGKSALYWLDSWSTDAQGASTAFKAMGSNAVSFLTKILEEKPSKLGEFADKRLSEYSIKHPGAVSEEFRRLLPSAYRTENRRETAGYLLSEIGPEAEAAIPTLFRIYTDTNENWRVQGEAGRALGCVGEKGIVLVPCYLSWLTNNDPEIQVEGAGYLATVGPKAKVAVPALLRAVETGNRRVSSAAARALWSIDRQTNIFLRVITRDLQNTNETVRRVALIYLREMGPAASAAGSVVQQQLGDRFDQIRLEAEKTLQVIAPNLLEKSKQKLNEERDATIARLIKTIREGEFPDRYRAVEAIAVFGPLAKAAVPTLVEALAGFMPTAAGGLAWTAKMNSQMAVAEALAEIGPEARPAAPALIDLIHQPNGYHAWYCKTLGRIGPDAKEAIPVLEERLQEENRGIRLAAADALTRIVPNGCSNAVIVLKSLQHDPQLATVWETDGHGAAALTSRKDYQNSTSRFFRLASAVSLWRLGLEKESPAPALTEELKKSNETETLQYIEMAGELGPEARAAVPELRKVLGPEKWIRLRRAAAIRFEK